MKWVILCCLNSSFLLFSSEHNVAMIAIIWWSFMLNGLVSSQQKTVLRSPDQHNLQIVFRKIIALSISKDTNSAHMGWCQKSVTEDTAQFTKLSITQSVFTGLDFVWSLGFRVDWLLFWGWLFVGYFFQIWRLQWVLTARPPSSKRNFS